MANVKESDLSFMTEAEVTEAYANAVLNHMRIIVSTEVQDWCNNRIPKLFDYFCQTHYQAMRAFCKETVDHEHESDFRQLLLDGFHVFFGSYHAHTKRDPVQVADDINTLGTRLVMNYYFRPFEKTRSLTLMVDFLPMYVVEQENLFNTFQLVRCTHEFELNSLH